MGLAIKELMVIRESSVESLEGKSFAVDTFNLLYMFITTIRGRDGSALMDSSGNVTSHLVGLFSRVTKLMQSNIKLVFVFDGKAPVLKQKERERRARLKQEAQKSYVTAIDEEDVDAMKKFAGRTSKLTPEMIADAKELLSALGLPIIEAPSEGEAQAARIAKNGDVYGVISQDFDSLMHGAPRLIRNLSIAGKRKKTNRLSFETISPEELILVENLKHLELSPDQFICLAMIVGTDYNVGGIKGIGPKGALKLVKKFGSDFDSLFSEAKWNEHFDVAWTEVFWAIKNIDCTDEYKLEFRDVDEEKVRDLLIKRHDFDPERVNSTLESLQKMKKVKKQKGLSDFF